MLMSPPPKFTHHLDRTCRRRSSPPVRWPHVAPREILQSMNKREDE